MNHLNVKSFRILLLAFLFPLATIGYSQQPPSADNLDEWESASHGILFGKPAYMHCRIGREKGAKESIVSSSEGTWTSYGMTWFSGAITAQVGDYDLYFNGHGAPYDGYLVNVRDKNRPLPATVRILNNRGGGQEIVIEKKLTLKTEIWGRFPVRWKKI